MSRRSVTKADPERRCIPLQVGRDRGSTELAEVRARRPDCCRPWRPSPSCSNFPHCLNVGDGMKKPETQNEIVLYKAKDGRTSLEVNLAQDTVWLPQSQIMTLFQRDQSVISRHIRNLFAEGELEQESNVQKMHIAGSDKPVVLYNLDVIISVG